MQEEPNNNIRRLEQHKRIEQQHKKSQVAMQGEPNNNTRRRR